MTFNNVPDNPWRLVKKVLPQHTDHAGVMWHGAYIAWLEEARVQALEMAGLPYEELTSQGFEMPVVRLNIKYLKAAIHGDEVVMESVHLSRNRLRLPWKTVFFKEGGEVIAIAEVELVLVKQEVGNTKLVKNVPLQVEEALTNLRKGP
ncbi:acyl-CoA thioesterase [Prochlorococcus sp. MIT 1341]|uniref:acyl-CoA thioesterase n=1 Tax=Prochlorococcus sp. MIT 1341 TaxID=3096221 RepID=UPI002A756A64|nr:acyl-CoA thioesterase [Prochlorococcus sp. MIT 1341]